MAAQSLGKNICNILPALHALTVCDTTSRLCNKKQSLKAASSDSVQKALEPLGNLFLNNQQFKDIEKVCTYIFSKKQLTADELRYKLISQNIGFRLNLLRIICTTDALYLHCLRASAQTYLWKNSSQPVVEPIDFTTLGYEIRDGNLYPIQITKPPLPESLINPCKCNSNYRTMSCSCKKPNLICISMCKCTSNDCTNTIIN